MLREVGPLEAGNLAGLEVVWVGGRSRLSRSRSPAAGGRPSEDQVDRAGRAASEEAGAAAEEEEEVVVVGSVVGSVVEGEGWAVGVAVVVVASPAGEAVVVSGVEEEAVASVEEDLLEAALEEVPAMTGMVLEAASGKFVNRMSTNNFLPFS